jgi:hypothetical protein
MYAQTMDYNPRLGHIVYVSSGGYPVQSTCNDAFPAEHQIFIRMNKNQLTL